ncbi:hypothetical protein, partial [Pseudonocardia acaciae]|uniref:hypothetical protein n=1 Tax=Pseudonocardia acaciae TaxID=551276 RepID=UPI00056B9C94
SHKIPVYNDDPIHTPARTEICGNYCSNNIPEKNWAPGEVKVGEKAVGDNNGLSVVTPDGTGKGGTVGCDGDCNLTRPKDMEQAPELKGVHLIEPMVKRGELATQPAVLEFRGPDDPHHKPAEVQHWVGPDGNRSQCDSTNGPCHIGMVYGPGGGVVCTGAGCDSTNTKGQHLAGAGYLLFPTVDKDGKITGHSGYGCETFGQCTASEGLKNLGTLSPGQVHPAWMGGIDPSYLRPGQDTPVDKHIYEALAPLGIKPGDPLPPLDAAGEQLLRDYDHDHNTHFYDQYMADLPELTTGQKDMAVLKVAGAWDTLQDRSQKLETQLPGLQKAVEAQKLYNEGKLSQAELQPHLKVIKQALSMDREYANARALVDSISGLTYQPRTSEQDQKTGADPKILQPGQGESIRDAEKRTADTKLPEMGVDAATGKSPKLNQEEQAKASAATVVGVYLPTRIEALNQEWDQWNARNEELKAGGATQDQVDQMDQWSKQLGGKQEAIKAVQGNIAGLQKDLPGKVKMSPHDQRLADMTAFEARGDPKLAERLRAWDKLQTDAEGLATEMEAPTASQYRQQLAKEYYRPLSTLAGLNYNTLAHDQGSRDPHSQIGDMPLPSTGHPDLYLAALSAYNSTPQNENAARNAQLAGLLDQGGAKADKEGKSLAPGATPADRRADLAAQGIVDEPGLWRKYFQDLGVRDLADVNQLSEEEKKQLGVPVDAIEQYKKSHPEKGPITANGIFVKDDKDGMYYADFTFTGEFLKVEQRSGFYEAKVGDPPGKKPEYEQKIFDRNGHRYSDFDDFYTHNRMYKEGTQISTSRNWSTARATTASGDTYYTGGGKKPPNWWERNSDWVLGVPMVVGGIMTLPAGGWAVAGFGIMGAAGAVGAVEKVNHLQEMSDHGVSINPFGSGDAGREARSTWLGLGGDLLSLGAMGPAMGAAKAGATAYKAYKSGDEVLAATSAAEALKTGYSPVAKWANRAAIADYTYLNISATHDYLNSDEHSGWKTRQTVMGWAMLGMPMASHRVMERFAPGKTLGARMNALVHSGGTSLTMPPGLTGSGLPAQIRVIEGQNGEVASVKGAEGEVREVRNAPSNQIPEERSRVFEVNSQGETREVR